MEGPRRLEGLPRGCSAAAWLEGLLPHPPEALGSRLDRCRKALEEGSFDPEASLLAGRREEPAGLVVCTTEGSESRIEILAVGENHRRRGLGRALLKAAISSLRERGQAVVRAEPVSSREGPWRSLLESLGFAGRSPRVPAHAPDPERGPSRLPGSAGVRAAQPRARGGGGLGASEERLLSRRPLAAGTLPGGAGRQPGLRAGQDPGGHPGGKARRHHHRLGGRPRRGARRAHPLGGRASPASRRGPGQGPERPAPCGSWRRGATPMPG